MDESFKVYVPEKVAGTQQQSVRIRPEDVDVLSMIAEVEGDERILALMYEGIGRVITSRLTDPEWMKTAKAFYESLAEENSRRADELEARSRGI